MNLNRIVEIVINKVRTDYANDVAVMCVYGSTIHNATHEKSDVDFYFIPKSERAYELSKTFIIDDIGFDFWAISWERVESIADYKQGFVSLVADAEVVWHSSQGDLDRFHALQFRAKNPKIDFDSRMRELLTNFEHQYFEICEYQGYFSLQKQKTARLAADIVEALAIINHTYTHRGWKSSLDEALQFEKIPKDFEETFKSVLFAKNSEALTEYLFEMIFSVKKLVSEAKAYTTDYCIAFAMLYEEEKSIYNKLYHACDIGDGITAMMAGAAIQEEITEIMGFEAYQQFFCDIVSPFNADDLLAYRKIALSHEKQFRTFLCKNNIPVCRYANIDDFEKEMRGIV